MTFANMLVAILLVQLVNANSIEASNSTKCHSVCACLDNSTTLDCSNKNFTSIPQDLPSNTRVLLLNNNQIRNLTTRSFHQLPFLTKVDLTGNKIICDCSLNWTKEENFTVQLMATCDSPSWVKGRSLDNITTDDMCKVISAPPVTTTIVPSTMSGSTKTRSTMTEKITTTPATTVKPVITHSIPQLITTEHPMTTIEPKKTSVERQTTTVEQQTTTPGQQTTTAGQQTTTVGQHTTTVLSQTKTKQTNTDLDSTPTQRPSTPRPTTDNNLTDFHNLTSLLEMSTRKDLSAELLKEAIRTLESAVSRSKESDFATTKNVLLISSNLIRKDKRKTWSAANEKFSAGEKILNVVNKAVRNHALWILKSGSNDSSVHFNDSNLDVEIQVIIGEEIASRGIQFPSSKSPEEDYIQILGSSFKTAGKNKVAVVGIKSTDLGRVLPRRSSIDDFDNFMTSSGLLSASIVTTQKLDFSSSVRITFKNQRFLGRNKELAKCAFWKYSSDGNGGTASSAESGWSDSGCRVVSRNRSTTICSCQHLTDFAVLTQRKELIPDPIVIVFIATLCLLIGSLIAFIRNVVIWWKTRRERVAVLIHECLAFVLASAVFLLAIFLDYHKVMCMVFAALLHWFVLAIFCWILSEFIQLYLCVNFGWNRGSSRLKYFIILGWVAPFILVAITLAVTRELSYGSKQWCWYSNSSVILLTYVCPIALCILLSVVILLKIGCLKFGATDDREKKDLSVIMVLSTFLIPLVLCTFTAAKLSADRYDDKVFQYLFSVFCIFLGIYVMVYHCWLDREIVKLSVRKHVQRARPKRDYYSTNETVMYSEGTSEGKSFSLIFPSRKSPTKKEAPNKNDRKSAKRSDSASPFDYNSTMPMYPAVNDSSLKSFKSQVSTQQHTLETPPNTLSAITISRPNSQCIELTSLSDLDRRPDGAEQVDASEPSEFYGSRHSNPMDGERQRTSGCSNDMTNASTFGKERAEQKPSPASTSNGEGKNRVSGGSSAGVSRTSRSSVSGASLTAGAAEENLEDDAFEDQPFIRHDSELGPEIRSDPPAKIPKRRKRGSRRRMDDEYPDDESHEPKIKTRQSSSTLPSTENSSVKLKNYTSF